MSDALRTAAQAVVDASRDLDCDVGTYFDRISALEAALAAPPAAPPTIRLAPDHANWSRLYNETSNLMARLGLLGSVATDDARVADVMDALERLDGGSYCPGLAPRALAGAPLRELAAREDALERAEHDHLNCPACGGSGHIDDVRAVPAPVLPAVGLGDAADAARAVAPSASSPCGSCPCRASIAIAEAVADEREACARLCESMAIRCEQPGMQRDRYAAAIRGRSA